MYKSTSPSSEISEIAFYAKKVAPWLKSRFRTGTLWTRDAVRRHPFGTQWLSPRLRDVDDLTKPSVLGRLIDSFRRLF